MTGLSLEEARVRPVPPRRRVAEVRKRAPVRVLCVEANSDGTVGGSHQALYDLALRIDRERFTPVVLFYQSNRFSESLAEQGVEVHFFEAEHRRENEQYLSGGAARKAMTVLAAVRRRVALLRKLSIDLVHINNAPTAGSDDWLPATRVVGIPCISNVMGDARGDRGAVRRYLFRQYDRYLPISEFIVDSMLEAGVERTRMDLYHLGVDLEAVRRRVSKTPAEVRHELGIPRDRLLVLMVGNVRHWKGQHVVVEALGRLSPEVRETVHVAFAGGVTKEDVKYREGLVRRVEEIGIGHQVSLLGVRTDVPDLLSAADIAIHASVRPEPFGLVVIEAMAMGVPVIAANSGGPSEIVSEDSGVLVEPGDPEELAAALAGLAVDHGRREALGAGALKRVERFTIERYVRGVERTYQKVLG